MEKDFMSMSIQRERHKTRIFISLQQKRERNYEIGLTSQNRKKIDEGNKGKLHVSSKYTIGTENSVKSSEEMVYSRIDEWVSKRKCKETIWCDLLSRAISALKKATALGEIDFFYEITLKSQNSDEINYLHLFLASFLSLRNSLVLPATNGQQPEVISVIQTERMHESDDPFPIKRRIQVERQIIRERKPKEKQNACA